jgi:hypothetical protein
MAITLRNTKGSALTHAELDANFTTLQDKAREWVSVLDKGADSTGTNDSATAFSDAVGVAGFALVPPGTYKLDSSPTAGTWMLLPGVTLTGSGSLLGIQTIHYPASSGLATKVVSNSTTAAQAIGHVQRQVFNYSGTTSALSFGQTIETWTPTANTSTFNGALTAAYGSFSHFGSGTIARGVGGEFEAFNSGTATATLLVGVGSVASNGGTFAGEPEQTATNNGSATNLRGFASSVKNISSGTVSSASMFFGETAINSGGGTITNLFGLFLPDLLEGTNNYALYTQRGQVRLGDAVRISGNVTLPAATDDALYLTSGSGGASIGHIHVGDGSGKRVEFVKRTASTNTVLGYFSDTGHLQVTGAHITVPATVAQLTANQAAYNPSTAGVWRVSSDADARIIRGILAGVDGQNLTFININAAHTIVLKNEDALDSAANRIITGTGADITLAANENRRLIYDGTSSRWRVLT